MHARAAVTRGFSEVLAIKLILGAFYVAGVLAHSAALTALAAPTVNSYRLMRAEWTAYARHVSTRELERYAALF
jgi:glutamine synthetase